MNKYHSKSKFFFQCSAHPCLPHICFLTLARFTSCNGWVLLPHLHMYLPSCYVFARWTCFKRAFNPCLWAVRISCSAAVIEWNRKQWWLLPLGGRKKGQLLHLYLLITPIPSDLWLSGLLYNHLSLPQLIINLWVIKLVKLSCLHIDLSKSTFYVFSICWPSLEHITSIPFNQTQLWTLTSLN